MQLLTFNLDRQRFALSLDVVERVVRAVELTPLPGSPPVIRGAFSLEGSVVPVGDLRRRLGLPERDIALHDCIIIVRTPARLLGLLAEGDTAVAECAPEILVPTERILGAGQAMAAGRSMEAVAPLPDGLVMIENPALFLSLDEEASLAGALDGQR